MKVPFGASQKVNTAEKAGAAMAADVAEIQGPVPPPASIEARLSRLEKKVESLLVTVARLEE